MYILFFIFLCISFPKGVYFIPQGSITNSHNSYLSCSVSCLQFHSHLFFYFSFSTEYNIKLASLPAVLFCLPPAAPFHLTSGSIWWTNSCYQSNCIKNVYFFFLRFFNVFNCFQGSICIFPVLRFTLWPSSGESAGDSAQECLHGC